MHRQLRQLTVPRFHPLDTVLCATGNTPGAFLCAEVGHVTQQNSAVGIAQGDEIHGREGLLAQRGITDPEHRRAGLDHLKGTVTDLDRLARY
ncbi:hypothetical protein D3C78_1750750 [compost metagenome]